MNWQGPFHAGRTWKHGIRPDCRAGVADRLRTVAAGGGIDAAGNWSVSACCVGLPAGKMVVATGKNGLFAIAVCQDAA